MHPLNALALTTYRFALIGGYTPHIEEHSLVVVLVTHADQGMCSLHGYTELLAQFPRERLARGFSAMDLTAREFPLSLATISRQALRDEDLLATGKHAGDDLYGRFSSDRRR